MPRNWQARFWSGGGRGDSPPDHDCGGWVDWQERSSLVLRRISLNSLGGTSKSVDVAPSAHTVRGHVAAAEPRRFKFEVKGVDNESPATTAIGNRLDVGHSVSDRLCRARHPTTPAAGRAPPSAPAPPTPRPTLLPPLPTVDTVWGSSSSDVFAAGDGGIILHYDGSAWSPIKSGTTVELPTLWGTSGRDVFLVGFSGTILHYDGSAWSPMESGTYNNLIGVWGTSGSDVFAAGWSGTILHYDGKAWTPMKSGTTVRLWGNWGSSGRDVFAPGDGGTILHYDGSAWSPMNSWHHQCAHYRMGQFGPRCLCRGG